MMNRKEVQICGICEGDLKQLFKFADITVMPVEWYNQKEEEFFVVNTVFICGECGILFKKKSWLNWFGLAVHDWLTFFKELAVELSTAFDEEEDKGVEEK